MEILLFRQRSTLVAPRHTAARVDESFSDVRVPNLKYLNDEMKYFIQSFNIISFGEGGVSYLKYIIKNTRYFIQFSLLETYSRSGLVTR